ncbi:hypothetical protein KFL_000060310 [Klebsormidium nitens]|uniref:WWE domain-containing protein n=1 Tax=Klebsormidium nitens TaxID=105231 RepID=A0A0U9HHR8_KLENI|nr:hypothetical protein KFL_000060310 [Klebsormidium nitens]|eukprot:GAQ77966.1 hypothetical protein KFL_000060310 [Klebsormidium nitens]
MCITGQIPDPTTPGVWWRDDRKWRRYESTETDVIKEGLRNSQKWVTLEGVNNLLFGSRVTYTVDLRIMQQKSPGGFMRPVLIVDGAGAEGGPGEVQNGQALAANECPPFLRIWQRESGSSRWNLIPNIAARFLLRVTKTGASRCLLDEGNGRQVYMMHRAAPSAFPVEK